jgi:hypothetical protein
MRLICIREVGITVSRTRQQHKLFWLRCGLVKKRSSAFSRLPLMYYPILPALYLSSQPIQRAGWLTGSVLHLCSEDEFSSWLKIFVVSFYLRSSSGIVSQSGHDRFLPNPVHFIFYQSSYHKKTINSVVF